MGRVTDIRYVGYAVPDREAERAFYRDAWGLREVAEIDGLVYFAARGSDELFVVRLRRASVKSIDVIALAAPDRRNVDELFQAVQATGCKIIFAPKELTTFGGGYGFRFFSPDGLPFEVSSNVARGKAEILSPRAAVPEKISHIVLHSPGHKGLTQFFIDTLGFRLSDWLGDFMSFLRCNEWHHRLAILPGPPALNHVAYDMPNLDEMMRGIAKLKGVGKDLIWGPGRHTAGNNIFSYFTTPHDFSVEYTTELARIDEASWKPNTYEPKFEIMDQWGSGTGGPQSMPSPEADLALFKPSEV